jgi:hypothetical protein
MNAVGMLRKITKLLHDVATFLERKKRKENIVSENGSTL